MTLVGALNSSHDVFSRKYGIIRLIGIMTVYTYLLKLNLCLVVILALTDH